MAAKKDTKTKAAPVLRHVRQPGSMSEQIDTLEVGRSIAVAERHALNGMTDCTDIQESLKRQRSNMASYVARITREKDDRSFRVESGCYMTDDKVAIIACVTITRLD